MMLLSRKNLCQFVLFPMSRVDMPIALIHGDKDIGTIEALNIFSSNMFTPYVFYSSAFSRTFLLTNGTLVIASRWI
jgi:hypothetical protein